MTAEHTQAAERYRVALGYYQYVESEIGRWEVRSRKARQALQEAWEELTASRDAMRQNGATEPAIARTEDGEERNV